MNFSKKLSLTQSDVLWIFTLFGTAVGAGVLFLPIEAGINGIWPLIVLTIFTIPIVYLSHTFFSYFVLSASKAKDDITEVAKEHFGFKVGFLITCLYFLAIFPILLIYGVGLTNTVESFIVNQLKLSPPNRALCSLLLTSLMMLVIVFGEKIILKATEILVYPLVLLLFTISIYLIPHWNTSSIHYIPTKINFTKTLILTLPVLIFAFNFSPALSRFVLAQRKKYHSFAENKVTKILKINTVFLFVFVMFFVFSCVLALSPAAFSEAKLKNISVMTYLANSLDRPYFAVLASVIAITAITSSFFGHYLGAREGLKGLLNQLSENYRFKINQKILNYFIFVFFFFAIWFVSYMNPSILKLLEAFVGPVIAVLLFIMPVLAIYKVKVLEKYRKRLVRLTFIFLIGIFSIFVMIYNLYKLIL